MKLGKLPPILVGIGGALIAIGLFLIYIKIFTGLILLAVGFLLVLFLVPRGPRDDIQWPDG